MWPFRRKNIQRKQICEPEVILHKKAWPKERKNYMKRVAPSFIDSRIHDTPKQEKMNLLCLLDLERSEGASKKVDGLPQVQKLKIR